MKFFQPRHLPVGRWPACFRSGLDIARRRAGTLLAIGLAAALPAWGIATFVDPAKGDLGQIFAVYGIGIGIAHIVFAAVFVVCLADDGIGIEPASFLRVTVGCATFAFAMDCIVNGLYIVSVLIVFLVMPDALSSVHDSAPVPDAATWSLSRVLNMTGRPFDALNLFIALFARRTVSGLRAFFVIVIQACSLNLLLVTAVGCANLLMSMSTSTLPHMIDASSAFFRMLAFVPGSFLPVLLYPYVREIMGAGSENRRLTSDFAFGSARRMAPAGGSA